MTSRTKIIAGIAVVGTVAAVAALVGLTGAGKSTSALSGNRLLQSSAPEEDVKAFQSFVQKHNRNYLTKEEYNARLKIFSNNLGLIRSHDPVTAGFAIGVNKFADLSLDEFDKMMGFKEEQLAGDKFLEDDEEDQPEVVEEDGRNLQSYPASVDWRQKGAVNPIRNQGGCGSCYSFSSVASVEGMHKVKKGTLPLLSEQQIVDCSSGYGNNGCSGGLMTNSFNYLKSYKS
jgi:C1A family cysteine protease